MYVLYAFTWIILYLHSETFLDPKKTFHLFHGSCVLQLLTLGGLGVWWIYDLAGKAQCGLHPGRLTWNIQITHLERKMIFPTSMIMFHVNLLGFLWPLFFLRLPPVGFSTCGSDGWGPHWFQPCWYSCQLQGWAKTIAPFGQGRFFSSICCQRGIKKREKDGKLHRLGNFVWFDGFLQLDGHRSIMGMSVQVMNNVPHWAFVKLPCLKR